MKKPFTHTELGDVRCKCGRFLKKNVLSRQPNATLCYKCSQADKKKHGKISD